MQPLYQWFYSQLPVKQVETDGTIHLLNQSEAARLRRLEKLAIVLAAIFGAAGVLILYIPKYYYPQWFPETAISLFGFQFSVPLVFTCWSALLVFVEILLLTLMHIYCIHEMAVATGFLTYENKQQEKVKYSLMLVSREQKDKTIKRYGIDPLQDLNKNALLLWNLLIAIKASLTNLFFRFVVQRMLGRYALQWIKDMAGIPVFAAWNAWGSWQVLRQGRIVIMGQNLVEVAVKKIFGRFAANAIDKKLVFQTMELVAVSKRDYHGNHAVLIAQLNSLYGIEKPGPFSRLQYLENFKQANEDNRQLCSFLLVLGFLLDGSLSRVERKRLTELQQAGLPLPAWHELVLWKNQFLDGKDTATLWEKYHL